MFALVDCNNFYASCERVFQPSLIGRPVVVLSNNDGCVIARSNEAKEVGIPMGAPAFEYKELFERHKVAVFSSNFALYGDMSNRVMQLLSEFSPDMEVYSIDEAFLQLSGLEWKDLCRYGQQIRQRVVRGTGIPISVGIAPTKVLAKLANRIAKKFAERTQGVYVIDTESKREKALKWVLAEDIWGIGKRLATRLSAIGVRTAYDFTLLPDDWVKKHLSVVGLRIKQELEGKAVLGLELPSKKQSIATTRSFEQMYTRFEDLQERVSTFAAVCAEKLRRQQSCCGSIMVFVHTHPHRQDLPQYSRNVVVQLPYPSDSSLDLVQQALKGLRSIFRPGYHYKKAGVVVMDIVPREAVQLSLFHSPDPRHNALMRAVDKINTIHGHTVVQQAVRDLKRKWKMKQEKLSPRYTTSLSDILVLHCAEEKTTYFKNGMELGNEKK